MPSKWIIEKGTKLKRADGTIFEVTDAGHWSIIKGPCGTTDNVKWIGGDQFVGRSGRGYHVEIEKGV